MDSKNKEARAAEEVSDSAGVFENFDMDVDFGGSSDSENEGSIYDEISIAEMTFEEDSGRYTYPCPCGDMFEIYLEDLEEGEDIAYCPSCSLKIKVLDIDTVMGS